LACTYFCSLLLALHPFAAVQLAASSRLLQQAQDDTLDTADDDQSLDIDWASAAIKQTDQQNLWIAVIPQLPSDADVQVPDGWHSSIKAEGSSGELERVSQLSAS
jgi:hypothetical protein